MGFNRELSIMSQNAGSTAASLIAAIGVDTDASVEDVLEVFNLLRADVLRGTVDAAGGEPTEQQAKASGGGGFKRGGGSGGGAAGDVVINSGTHKGKSIAQAEEDAPGWCQWTVENGKNQFLKDKCEAYLAVLAAAAK